MPQPTVGDTVYVICEPNTKFCRFVPPIQGTIFKVYEGGIYVQINNMMYSVCDGQWFRTYRKAANRYIEWANEKIYDCEDIIQNYKSEIRSIELNPLFRI